MSDTEAEQVERLFGVWSVTGVHIGVWNDGLIAAMVHADEHPHGRLLEMVPAKDYDALSTQLAEATEKGRQQGRRVKPLEWENFDAWTWWARTPIGVYRVQEREGRWTTAFSWEGHSRQNSVDVDDNSEAAAKSAARADYERRILSALTEAPARDPVGEVVTDGDLYYLRAIQKRLEEFREALDGIEALSIGGEAFHDERDWLDCFIDAKSPALAGEGV